MYAHVYGSRHPTWIVALFCALIDCAFISLCGLLFIIIISENRLDGKHVGITEASDGNVANV
jgi:hypothetical protein